MSARLLFRGRRGLSMVEAMISLAITAALLTAVGVAFVSTAKAVETNDQFFRATQAARIAVTRITAQVRDAMVDPDPTYTNATRLHLITYSKNREQTYFVFTNTDGSKELRMTDAKTGITATVAHNITTASPFAVELTKGANNANFVTRVTVDLAVQVGVNSVRISGAAAPRWTISY